MRPMNNSNSSYDKGSCADGQLHCNPALFGKNLCVDFSSKSARVRAFSNCNQKFKDQGKNIEDIIQEMTDHEFYKAVGTVENVCRNNDLKQSKTAMCKSILKKFESYVPSSRPKSQAIALDALKSNNPDELTNALEDVLNELGQDKAQLDSKCSDQLIPPGNQAFCTNVAKRIIEAEKLAQRIADKIEVIITTDNVNCGELSSAPSNGPVDGLSRDVNNALVTQCTQENIDARNQSCGQEIACSITSTLMGPMLAGYLSLTGGSNSTGKRQCLSSENDCLTNVLTSLVDYLISSVKAVWSLSGMGVDWVTEKGKDFWGWVTNAEDETSKTQQAIQNLSDSDIKEIEEDSEGWFKKTLTGITSMLNEWIKTEVFCEKWSGAPNFSTCQQPMKGWECLGCGTMLNGMCRMAGPAIGLIAETVLTGGALAVISKGSKGVKTGIAAMKSSPKYMATIKRVQNTGFAQKLNKAKQAVITSSRLPKGQPLKYTKELLAKVAQLSKDKLSKIKNSGVVTKAKKILNKLSETKLVKVVKKVDEVDSKAFKAGYNTVDKALSKSTKPLVRSLQAQRIDFQSATTKPYSDEFKREQVLKQIICLSNAQREVLTSIALKNVNKVEDRIQELKELGLNQSQIERLNNSNFFNVDPIEIENISTLARLNPSSVRSGKTISIQSPDGHLTHARIRKVKGDKVFLEEMDGSIISTPFSKSSIYKPVQEGMEVLLKSSNGNIIVDTVRSIKEDGSVITFGNAPFGESVKMSQLKLQPRNQVKTSTKDFSEAISGARTAKMRYEFFKLDLLFSKDQLTTKFLYNNNNLIKSMQDELRKQGVSTTIIRSSYSPHVFNLKINGAHENGNKVARFYLRAANRVDSKELTISVVDNLRIESSGFNTHTGRTELGFDVALDMLNKKKNSTASHELRHQMFNKRRDEGEHSVYDNQFNARDADLDLHDNVKSKSDDISGGFYKGYMLTEELYTHISDSSNFIKKLRAKGSLSGEAYRKLKSRIKGLITLSENSKRVTNNILEILNEQIDSVVVSSGRAILKDKNGRNLEVLVSKKTQDLLRGDLAATKSDLQVAKEVIENKLAPDVRKTFEPHLNFLTTNPTKAQIEKYRMSLFDNGEGTSYWDYLSKEVADAQQKRARTQLKEELKRKVLQTHKLAGEVENQVSKIQTILKKKFISEKRRLKLLSEEIGKLRLNSRHHTN